MVSRRSSSSLIFLIFVMLGAEALDRIQVNSVTHNFMDQQGRTLIFHGMNAVEKLPPFVPSVDGGFDALHSLGPEDAANLRQWGFNVVRLGVLWQAVIPAADGQVNKTYLDKVERVVEVLAAENIRTIIDMHQDAMGSLFCGEGFPSWAVDKALSIAGFNKSDPATRFPAPFDWDMGTGHLPSPEACSEHNFFDYYKTDESLAAWTAFLSAPALWAEFSRHWTAVAARFAGNPAVLGYELINEPYAPEGAWTSSDKDLLLPLYEAVHAAIRAVDNTTIIFYETRVMADQYGRSTDFPLGGPGGEAYNDRQALAYHIYCFNTTSPLLEPVCALAFDLAWHATDVSRERVGGGGFLSEFGAVGEDSMSLWQIETMLDHAEARAQSWAYWTMKSFDDITTEGSPTSETLYHADGSLQDAKLAALTRPYAPLVAGDPRLIQYDRGSRTFTLEYIVQSRNVASAHVAGTTIVFPGRYHYAASGFEVTVRVGGPSPGRYAAAVTVGGDAFNSTVIEVLAKQAGAARAGDVVVVTVTAK